MVVTWSIELVNAHGTPWGYLLRDGKVYSVGGHSSLLQWKQQYEKDPPVMSTSSNMVTTRNQPKGFTWSYSRLKNFEQCPKRHYEIDVIKSVKEEEGESLQYGNQLHSNIAKRLSKQTPLPKPYDFMEKWALKVERGVGDLYVEQKLAIKQDMSPCGYFDPGVWFRGVADVILINGRVGLVLDWKTGKIVEDSVQLALTAQCIFAHYPEVTHVMSSFIWLKEDARTDAKFSRADMVNVWAALMPRVGALKKANDLTEYPAKPNGLCKRFCPVTKCAHNGQ